MKETINLSKYYRHVTWGSHQTKNIYCPIGSQFHKQLCSDYINILEDFLNTIKDRIQSKYNSSC